MRNNQKISLNGGDKQRLLSQRKKIVGGLYRSRRGFWAKLFENTLGIKLVTWPDDKDVKEHFYQKCFFLKPNLIYSL